MVCAPNLGRYGRLGNQLFQYAMLKAVALRIGCAAKIPRWRDGVLGVSPLQLAPFQLTAQELSDSDVAQHEFHEPIGCFATYLPEVFDVPEGTAFFGYYQSWKYFADYEQEIRQEFRFAEDYARRARIEAHRFRASGRPLVSLHVRRGDYLTASDGLAHRSAEPAYYERAMREFRDAQFLVFSDDLAWCRQQFVGDAFKFSEGTDHWLDLALMAHCDHHIVAASTFSWWGAWLNPRSDKRVVAPEPWVGPALQQYSTADIYPPDWIKL